MVRLTEFSPLLVSRARGDQDSQGFAENLARTVRFCCKRSERGHLESAVRHLLHLAAALNLTWIFFHSPRQNYIQ